MSTRTVEAAGGIVLRDAKGRPEVLLVHRPAYDDWTFPKGKLDPGERHADAALREVLEETGLRCALEESAGRVEYVDRKGRPKVARYWFMRPVRDEGFTPNDEVDELRWLPLSKAAQLLSYKRDRKLLRASLAE